MTHPIHLAAIGSLGTVVGFLLRHALWLWNNRRQAVNAAACVTAEVARLTQHLADILNAPPDQDLLTLGMQIEQAAHGDHALAATLAPIARALAAAPSPAASLAGKQAVLEAIASAVAAPTPAPTPAPVPVTTYIADGAAPVVPAVVTTPASPTAPEGAA